MSRPDFRQRSWEGTESSHTGVMHHPCPVLPSFPGKRKKLRHLCRRISGGAAAARRAGGRRKKPREQGAQTAQGGNEGAVTDGPPRAQTPRAGPPTTEPRRHGNEGTNRNEGTRGTGRPADEAGTQGPTRGRSASRGPTAPTDTLRPGGLKRGRPQGGRPRPRPTRPGHHSGLGEHEPKPAHRKQPPGEVWAARRVPAEPGTESEGGRGTGRDTERALLHHRAQMRFAHLRQRSQGELFAPLTTSWWCRCRMQSWSP